MKILEKKKKMSRGSETCVIIMRPTYKNPLYFCILAMDTWTLRIKYVIPFMIIQKGRNN